MSVRAQPLLALTLFLIAWHAAAADAVRGAYLVFAGGCIACHIGASESANDLSGGQAIVSPFGTFYAPNITPDPTTGIGGWTEQEFLRAMKHGLSPSNDAYYPAFPYMSYAGATDQDIIDLKAYLDTLPPMNVKNREHDLSWYLNRWSMRLWQWLFFEPHAFDAGSYADADITRGAYLVRHLGHCGECHTPRNMLGVPDNIHELAGNPEGPDGDPIPNLTPNPDTGLGKWTTTDIVNLLSDGTLLDGDFVGGAMTDVVDHNTSHLTDADRTAIATYLKALPPLR